MTDISSNRTDLVADSSRLPGELPASTHGQQTANAVPAARAPRPAQIVRPSTRPDEPVTAGLPIGAGPGPTGIAAMGERERALVRLRVAASRSSSPALHRLLSRLGG